MTEMGVGDDGVVKHHDQRQEAARVIERALRVAAFGAACACAGATDSEMEVMRSPGRVVASDVAAGNPIQQG